MYAGPQNVGAGNEVYYDVNTLDNGIEWLFCPKSAIFCQLFNYFFQIGLPKIVYFSPQNRAELFKMQLFIKKSVESHNGKQELTGLQTL